MKTIAHTLFVTVLLASSQLLYAQTDHSAHGKHQAKPAYTAPKHKGQLDALPSIPDSGKAREAGADDRYIMETTSSGDSLAQKCAKGTRGIVMLDNKTWQRCGGKPKGAAQGLEKQQKGQVDHSQH